MKSEEVAKRLLKIDEKLYVYLTKFNELKRERDKILAYAENNEIDEKLKEKMKESIEEFEHVLKVIKELEEQTKNLKEMLKQEG